VAVDLPKRRQDIERRAAGDVEDDARRGGCSRNAARLVAPTASARIAAAGEKPLSTLRVAPFTLDDEDVFGRFSVEVRMLAICCFSYASSVRTARRLQSKRDATFISLSWRQKSGRRHARDMVERRKTLHREPSTVHD
jgi:hypothetical protein